MKHLSEEEDIAKSKEGDELKKSEEDTDIGSESPDDMDDENFEDSSFIKPDMVGYFKSVIKPDVVKYEKRHLNSKIPLFTKDMKVSNITDKRDFAVLNSAAYVFRFTKYLKAVAVNEKDKLEFEDWIAFDANYRLNLLSSMDGFERKIEHSQLRDTTKTIHDEKNYKKRRPFMDSVFGKGGNR